MRAWHFLPDNGLTGYPHGRGNRMRVKEGQTLRVKPPLRLCFHGLHASAEPIDALRYAPGSIICRVECEGDILTSADKLVCSERTVIWVADATKTLHEYACWCAHLALKVWEKREGRKADPRSWKAIHCKRRWLRGEITDKELGAARSAAWDAARSAARNAAWNAAWNAARDAARGAARCAAWDAARGAARDAQNKELARRLRKLGRER